jgi:hypothetical protein
MDLEEAWRELGLSPHAGWDAVRPAYRRMIGELHPDRAGSALTSRAARVNLAYAVLKQARLTDVAPTPPPPNVPVAPVQQQEEPIGPIDPGEVSLLRLRMTPEEAFVRLRAAGDAIGDVGYVDRSSGVLEVLVTEGDELCSLLVTVEARGDGTDVVIALEALTRVASLPPGRFVKELLRAVLDHHP